MKLQSTSRVTWSFFFKNQIDRWPINGQCSQCLNHLLSIGVNSHTNKCGSVFILPSARGSKGAKRLLHFWSYIRHCLNWLKPIRFGKTGLQRPQEWDPSFQGLESNRNVAFLCFFVRKAMIKWWFKGPKHFEMQCCMLHPENDFLLTRPNNDLDVMPIMSDSDLEVGDLSSECIMGEFIIRSWTSISSC